MRFDLITLFPEMFDALLGAGVVARAKEKRLFELEYWNPRDFTEDRHRNVDDRPYGGGPGMVMMVEPIYRAIDAAREAGAGESPVVYLSPQGRRLDHQGVKALGQRSGLILLCGRYEGIDERLFDLCIDEEWSIGDYVLTGGELPAMVVMDALVRQLPGVVGNESSLSQESHFGGLLDCGHYTRPEEFAGLQVPQVLLRGHHEKIGRWRMKQALGRTWLKRPDLLEVAELSELETQLLEEFQQEHQKAENSHVKHH